MSDCSEPSGDTASSPLRRGPLPGLSATFPEQSEECSVVPGSIENSPLPIGPSEANTR
ncbi:hypothetical protein [Nonomuraea roseola]|uniref:hypothetical protein n=1 Tax=Nonomuraea roseola TaxID=46179 RepID=UPI0031FA413D